MSKDLSGKKILITRSKDNSENAFKLLEEKGAEVFYIPTIKIVPVDDYSDFRRALIDINKYSFIIFTSVNAVNFFFEKAKDIDLSKLLVAAVGKKTAQVCEENNIPIDIIPGEFSAKGLIEKFKTLDLRGKKVLIPGSAISRTELRKGLAELGADVDFIPIYDIAVPDKSEIVPEYFDVEAIDVFVFTSPSTFNNFLAIFQIKSAQDFFNSKLAAAIGPTTKARLKEKGLEVQIVPEEFTTTGLTNEIIKFYT